MHRTIFLLFLLPLVLAAADSDHRILEEGKKEWDEFEASKATHHPWNRDLALPSVLADAGLRAPVKRCALMPIWRDGGSTGGFVRDPDGRYLAFAIARPFSGWDDTFKPRPRFYLGSTWWRDPGVVLVPYDSPCEKMLIGFLGDLWQEIEAEHMTIIDDFRKRSLEESTGNEALLKMCVAALEDYKNRKAAQPGATDNPDNAQ
jgi:hypothetical protein